MSEKDPKSTSEGMDEDNVDLTTVMEVELSGDPKRDKVSCAFRLDSSRLGARSSLQGSSTAEAG